MSAGSGVQHSEFNGSHQRPVHFLQIGSCRTSSAFPRNTRKELAEGEKRGRLV